MPAEVLRAVSDHLALGVANVLWAVAVLAGIAAVVAMAFPAVAAVGSVAPPPHVPVPEASEG